MSVTRWQSERSESDSRQYIERFDNLAQQGADIHGEARFVDAVVGRGSRILDAGCGTGRVGLELARRGHLVTSVDLDPVLIADALTHPELDVHLGDLAELDLGKKFDAVVAAGNVFIFLARGTEHTVLRRLADHLEPGGVLITGFATDYDYGVDNFDSDLAAVGLSVEQRFSTWDLRQWRADATWVVTLARKN
ncbi:class I SAM-dependent methyltransferase [Rhodococcus sp. IEGM 1379]|uniref:class I SAM-dependent methyltransferase n=1 Tax=Rhodococcus sp. IEGM 1379 TaxID=3047086 RepID=UPI0024B74A65|nr:class I SAM-dependent methyltransferase [Rhodococcus sp. IEGM 1379]MDI9918571.1 methyltransferase domain-containing protein [Rhodococcus sp. IEGM 1379]